MNDPVFKIAPGKTDVELAADLKARCEQAMSPVIEVINAAAAHGLELNFQIGRDHAKRAIISSITVHKSF